MKRNKLWGTFLAIGISALALPPFVQSQTAADQTAPSGSSTSDVKGAPSERGTSGLGETHGTTEPSRTMENPSAQGNTGMNSPSRSGSAMTNQGKTEADLALNQRIRQALMSDSTLASAANKVHFNTDNGKVTLHGTVATEKDKKDIKTKVEKVAGVKAVDNQLQIAPAS